MRFIEYSDLVDRAVVIPFPFRLAPGHVPLLLPVAVPRENAGVCEQHRLSAESAVSTAVAPPPAPPTPRPHAAEAEDQEFRTVRVLDRLTHSIQ